MNTQTILFNKKNVIRNSNNGKYLYKFPYSVVLDSHEIALASLNMYYSWPNIQAVYNNNIFQYMWWDYQGNLTSLQTVTIPDGYYSISTLSGYIQSQMYIRGHYLVDSKTLNKIYFISLLENPTYYACEITFDSVYANGTTGYTNENPPTQVYVNGVQVWQGWLQPSTKQYPQAVFSDSYEMKDFLGFASGTYPISSIPIVSEYDLLGTLTPVTYPVSAINVQCNMCKSDIAIPDNVLFSFSQGVANYGDLIIKEPQNLIWSRIPKGTYNELTLNFVDQDFDPVKILDDQVNFIVLIREN